MHIYCLTVSLGRSLGTIQFNPLFKVSRGCNQGASQAVFLPGCVNGEGSASELILVVGRLCFPVIV